MLRLSSEAELSRQGRTESAIAIAIASVGMAVHSNRKTNMFAFSGVLLLHRDVPEWDRDL